MKANFGEFLGLSTCHVHDWLTVPGGAEECLKRMYESIPAPIVAAQYNAEKFPWLDPTHVTSHWISKMPLSKTKHYIYAPVLGDAYRSLNLDPYKLVITNSHSFSHNVRPSADAIYYCYYHTTTRALWTPEIDGRAGTGMVRNAIVKRLKKWDYLAAQQPNYLVANSNTTRERIEKFYRRHVDEVIYPPVEIDKFMDIERKGDDEGFLIWGRQIAYKKTDVAIQAALQSGFKLNIVGSGPMIESLKALAGSAPNIKFHGRLPDDQLKSMMSRSKAFLFPAYEDFGIVVVEALSAGLPVVAYKQGGASESLTPETGEFIDEQTPNSVCEAIERFEKRTFDPLVARQRAQLFSVERFKNEFETSVQRAVERGTERRFL